MRYMTFSTRNRKEILRDPLSLAFGMGFPIVLILVISLIRQSIKDMPVEIFGIEKFAPGMTVFALSFISLFLGMLIANDRNSSFLMRLFATPMTASDFILGYSIPLLPISIMQTIVCFGMSAIVGLPITINLLMVLVVVIPVAILFISIGILLGSLLSNTQVGGISSILVNAAALLSSTWFDLEMIGGIYRTVSYSLPFAHAVDLIKAAVGGNYGEILPHLLWVCGYSVLIFIFAILAFRKQMRS